MEIDKLQNLELNIAYSGTTERMSSYLASGDKIADKEIIVGLISNAGIITNITDTNNWANSLYIGPTVAVFEGQYYYDANYKYEAESDSAIIRISIIEVASSFLALTDTPTDYTGSSLQSVRVNSGETGLEFYTPTSGTGSFTGLTDTPASYVTQTGKLAAVNAGESALEFVDNLLHVQNTDYRIIDSGIPVYIPGTNTILELVNYLGISISTSNIGDYCTQTFRNEDAGGGVYFEAFNKFYLWIAGPTDSIMKSELFRGDTATGTIISTNTFNCQGNGTWISMLGDGDVIKASELEIFTVQVTYISGTGTISYILSGDSYLYDALFNGAPYNNYPLQLLLQAVDIDIIEPLNSQVLATSDSIAITADTLTFNGSPLESSKWTSSGSDIYYTAGNVSIGISSTTSKLAVVGLPTASTGLVTGDFFTQTATELGGTGTTKVVCVV